MRAALIKAFGEPTEVLELVDVPEPSGPAAGEVLVGVEYAPINMNDLYVIQGAFPVRPSLPSIVGNEGVGRVLAVGSGVEHLKVGDRVLIPLYAFSWRERLVVPATGLFSLPEAEPQQLAMLGINPPTASLLLDEASDLKPGDWVVQNAANSGVGRSLIAIAKARGIKTINLVRRPELIPELQAIGGDLVVVDEDGALDKIRDSSRKRSRAARHRRSCGQEQRHDRRRAQRAWDLRCLCVHGRRAGRDQPVRPDRQAHRRQRLLPEPSRHRAED